MALTIEIGSRFNLQFGGMQVSVHQAIAFQLKEFLDLDGTRDFSHDIGLLATDISFHDAVGADDDFGSADNIADQCSVDPQIAAAGHVSLESRSAADKACAAVG